MSMKCQNCDKGVQYGHYVSHAKNRTKRLFKPNLKRVTIGKGKDKKRIMLCTKCVKKIKRDGYK